MNRYIHTMCMAFGADGEPDRVEVDATFDYLVAGSAVSDIRVLKIDGRAVAVDDADLHDRIHDDLASGRFDDLLISLATPSSQSVFVPVELAETPAIRNALGLYRSAILCGEQWSDTCRDAYLAALKELDQLAMLAAAPAPSSLAGGEVSMGQRAFEAMRNANRPKDHREWSDLTDDQRNEWQEDATERPHLYGLAALSPEAPAREEESKGVGIGLCIAAGIAVASGAEGAAREILGAAGLTTEVAMREAGVDAYDISLLADIIKEMAEKANG